MLTYRQFLDREFWVFCAMEYQAIGQRRRERKGKPDEYERINIELDKHFASHYKKLLT